MPSTNQPFSASVGPTVDKAAAGVPHGTIRIATAMQIRTAGALMEYLPEIDQDSGKMNWQHVHVTEVIAPSVFGSPMPNPVPRRRRFGGPDYVDPGPLFQGASP